MTTWKTFIVDVATGERHPFKQFFSTWISESEVREWAAAWTQMCGRNGTERRVEVETHTVEVGS